MKACIFLAVACVTAALVIPFSAEPLQAAEQIAKITASDAARTDLFGSAVSIEGFTALVGAPQDDETADTDEDYGAAYIFEGDPKDPSAWTQVAKLIPSTRVRDAHFGNAVALSGDTAIVGAFRENGMTGGLHGAAYVFERDQGGTDQWGQVAKLMPSSLQQGDQFGVSVAFDGTHALIGAHHDDDNGLTSGSAYIFERNGAGGWTEVTKLLADNGVTMDAFGTSVSIQGDTALVGAPFHNHGTSNNGSVYVFQRVENEWIQVDELRAFHPEAGALFGHAVSLDGTTALIGAYHDDGGGEQNSGSAFIFARNPNDLPGWIQVKELIASDGAQGDDFGWAVSLSGSTALIGTMNDSTGAHNAGSAYIFQRNQGGPGQWGEVTELLSDDIDDGDHFGTAVSIRGGYAVIGAMSNDDADTNSGSAYVFAVDQPLAPRLTIPTAIPGVVDEPVAVPVALDTQGTVLTGITLSIDYDSTCLDFDPADNDFDGIPDAVSLHVPAQFAASIFFDLGDVHGELDLSLVDPLRASFLADGPVATVTFVPTPTCEPAHPATHITPVIFSANPTATFLNDDGQQISGETEGGSVEIHSGIRGDCNADGLLDTDDIDAVSSEILDGDGPSWLDAPGGSFVGSSVGCDANGDTIIDAGDLSCEGLLLDGAGCSVEPVASTEPWLSLPYELAVVDGTAVLDIGFSPAGHEIAASVFSLDVDETRLDFDPTDSDVDGLPDSMQLLDTAITDFTVDFDPARTDAELRISLAALNPSPASFSDAALLRIELSSLEATPTLEDAVRFATAPSATFGDTQGRSVPGETGFNLRALFADGFESGDVSAWSTP